jgi:dipeptidyl aminopeptidase/acylaminoacyl peptidase
LLAAPCDIVACVPHERRIDVTYLGTISSSPEIAMKRVAVMFVFAVAPLSAQSGTDIWQVTFGGTMRSPTVGAPVNVTNRPGYDNQPSFTPDGRTMYFTSQRNGQTDIYRFDVTAGTTTAVTRTPESEYSAQLMPGGAAISVIRVESDSSQRLWSFMLDGMAIKPVLDSLKPIGYHAWLDANTVFVYVLGANRAPATLQRVDIRSGKGVVVASGIGRTIVRSTEGSTIYYAQRDSARAWWVHALDGANDRAIVKLPSMQDDFFAVTTDGDLIAANRNQLLLYSHVDEKWIGLATFSEPGLQHITRIAFSPSGDRIALVGDEPLPPKQ